MREHQRALEKAQRELDRERGKLEQQEKKLIADIRKAAKNGQMVRLLALRCVALRCCFGMPSLRRVRYHRRHARRVALTSAWRHFSTDAALAILASWLRRRYDDLTRAQGSCKVMAKDLVRTRRYVSKFYSMRTQLQAISLRIQAMRSNQQMAEAMRGATRAMGQMSRTMNVPAMQRILLEFERESSAMDLKEEMMSDAVDDVMEVR